MALKRNWGGTSQHGSKHVAPTVLYQRCTSQVRLNRYGVADPGLTNVLISSAAQYVGEFVQKTVAPVLVRALRITIALPAGITSLPWSTVPSPFFFHS